ncbi:aminotransferase class I/II-fold pyridoxal phosphate-dependent enzyme [Kitasatospora misakiensis]|uniref:Aminotransferase class I/II-fold pyridoxal phosphate-dependent enzyme n=1 Tax=Kitasatospora misakiensis TaxID=67330 RepID=A0ABW0X8B7_9ACTN
MAGIAIVGMSCRLPGASGIDEYWKLLVSAQPQFSAVPENRWNHSHYFKAGETRDPHSTYTDQVAFIDDVDQFAPAHYGVPPRRARTMDPQARLFVDLAREAVQDAGWERAGFDRASTGVFAGVTSLDHRDVSVSWVTSSLLADGTLHGGEADPGLLAALRDAAESSLVPMGQFTIPGALANMVPATVSEVFDLGGPSISLDAACSSALVALDAAVRSLRTGACSIALVGGVYLSFTPTPLVGFSRARALSQDGVCRPFDERADGFVLGEGGAMLALRPVEDAIAAGDRIYAVVTGVGSANDGRGGGPMTPQAQGQLAALRAAYRDAGTSPGAIDLLELHGTGTPVGDRTEVEALRLLRADCEEVKPCYVSSSKALIGHTLSAAGAAGLVKAALAVHHGVVPPQPSGLRVNEALRLADSGLRVTTEPEQWPHEDVRRAAVSSFGFGGTNVHAVLESAPPPSSTARRPVRPAVDAVAVDTAADAATDGRPAEEPWLFLLSAGSTAKLAEHAGRIAQAVTDDPAADLAAVARTLAGRELLTARLAVVAATRAELLDRLGLAAERLAAGAVGELAPGVHAAAKPLPPAERKIAFAFPGQGSQRPGMLSDLFRRFPVLADRAAELAALTAEQSAAVAETLPGLLFEQHRRDDTEAQTALTATELCQPALGITGVTTTELLAACGVSPDIAVGHSVGEFPAAAAAGAFAGPETVRFMARRGAALAAAVPAGTGAMLAVQVPRADAERLAASVPDVWPACYNHSGQLVFSGSAETVERLRAVCAENDAVTVSLKVSHAFHSPLVAAADEAVSQVIAELPLSAPARTFVSSVSGASCSEPGEIRELWARHNTSPVRFTDAVTAVAEAGARFLVQLYGGDTLLRMAKRCEAGAGLEGLAVSAGRPDAGRAFMTVLGRLAVAGAPVDLAPLFPPGTQLLALPSSPLETSSFTVLTGTGRPRGADYRPTSPRPDTAVPPPAPRPAASVARTIIPAPAMPATAPTSRIGSPSMSGLIEFLHAQVTLLQSFDPSAQPAASPRLATANGTALNGTALNGTTVNGTEANGAHLITEWVPETAAAAPHGVRLLAAAPAPTPLPVQAAAPAPALPAAPGRADEVLPLVREAIAGVSAYPADFLRPEHSFATDLGFDSLMIAEMTARLRKQWPGLEVEITEIVTITTVGALADLLRQKLGIAPETSEVAPPAPVLDQTPTEPAPAVLTRTEPAPAVRDHRETADVRAFPEIVASVERSKLAERAGVRNPYFLVHDGVIGGTTHVDGQELISFSSYNYLGLSGHPAVAKAMVEAVEKYGSSVSAARILSGSRPLHEELDQGIAELIGAEDALTLVSGHATNVTVIGHLMGPEDLIVHDALAHDSILQGCRQSGAARQPFPHNDVAALDRILTQVRDRYRRVLIVVEGVYSMDGDTADLPALIAVKQKHSALLMVDEAHSIGVMGKTGGGMAEHSGVTPADVDIWMGTLSKSLASCGGYVAGRHELIQHFRYTLPGFVFSAGLPPASTAAALAALRLIRAEPERVTRLHDRSALFLRLAAKAGIEVGTSDGTPIVPCITGDSHKALLLADRLYSRGISANPILHPAVEERLARLRFFITSEHTEEQIETTVAVLAEELSRLS